MENYTLAERRAAAAYAKAWNRLDCRKFLDLLSEDSRYASQYVFEELVGREKISDNLMGKMQAVKAAQSKVVAGLGTIETPEPERNCVLLFQNPKEERDYGCSSR